jgi:hypothetical protein
MKKITAAISLILLFMAPTAFSQRQQGQPNENRGASRALLRFLQLDEVQRPAFQELVKARKSTVQPLQEELAALRVTWKETLASSSAETIGNLALEIHGLQEQIKGANEVFRASFADMLTEEQKRRLRQLHRALRLQALAQEAQRLGIVKID